MPTTTRILTITRSSASSDDDAFHSFSLSSRLFEPLGELRELRLNFCGLRRLAADAFARLGGTLERLDLSSNRLEHLDEVNFRNLTRVSELRLDRNRLESLHSGVFYYMKRLRVLTLSDNALRELPRRLTLHLKRLEVYV